MKFTVIFLKTFFVASLDNRKFYYINFFHLEFWLLPDILALLCQKLKKKTKKTHTSRSNIIKSNVN